jgi:abhydrolase domain-containing protein 17
MGAVTSTVAARFAFFPPTPPSYGVTEKEQGQVLELTQVPRRSNVEARRIQTKRGNGIIAMHVRNPGAKLTLLYSHGNAADLGQMYELFVELSLHLGVNLMG